MSMPLPAAATTAQQRLGFATCPSCHAADATITNGAVKDGAAWQCARCGQRWDATRAAAVAAYAVWVSGHNDVLAIAASGAKSRDALPVWEDDGGA